MAPRRKSLKSVATWSLRLRAVWSLPPGAGELREAGLEVHVHVLKLLPPGESARLYLLLYPVQAPEDGL